MGERLIRLTLSVTKQVIAIKPSRIVSVVSSGAGSIVELDSGEKLSVEETFESVLLMRDQGHSGLPSIAPGFAAQDEHHTDFWVDDEPFERTGPTLPLSGGGFIDDD